MKRLFLFFFAASVSIPGIDAGAPEDGLWGNSPGGGNIVFNEVMYDPVPELGLPGYEYIELYNRGGTAVSLGGWILQAGTRILSMPEHLLLPDTYLLLCYKGTKDLYPGAASSIDLLNSKTILRNEGTLLLLMDPDSLIIDWMEYTPGLHAGGYYAEGGWSLERIDPGRPCHSPGNWTSSTDREGGTPGRENSVKRPNPDRDPPGFGGVYLPDSQNLVIEFTESMTPASMMQQDAWYVDGGMGFADSLILGSPCNREIRLKFGKGFSPGRTYHLEVRRDLEDCSGNRLETGRKIRFALPVQPGSRDILISEVLFNPLPFCPDFIEVFNPGTMTFDLADVRLANRDAENGEIVSAGRILDGHRLFFPEEYLVFTDDPESLCSFYFVHDPSVLVKAGDMPSMGDREGSVLVLDKYLNVLDEFTYHSDMHHPALVSQEGVSLERITFEGSSTDRANWHSAAVSDGYGTPGRQNSQHVEESMDHEGVRVHPEIFTPDMDGKRDLLLIRYAFRIPGLKARILVLDPRGRIVRTIADGALLGTEGFFTWDGTDTYGRRVRSGIYLILAEVCGKNIKIRRFRETCVLSRGR